MDTSLDSALTRLVADGVLTEGQARAVSSAVADAGDHSRGGRGLSAVAETLAYAGAAVAGAAALALASLWWDLLSAPAQTGVLLLAALGLFGAGWWVDEEDASGAVRRLVAFTWSFAVIAGTGAVGVVANAWDALSTDGALLVVGVVATASSAVLVRRRPSPLLLVLLLLGLQTAAFALAEVLFSPVDVELGALLGWSVCATFGLLVWGGFVGPRGAGYVLAAAGALLSAQVLAFDTTVAGLALGIVTSVGLLATMRLGARALAGLGAAGLVVFLPQVLSELFPGRVSAPVALFTVGLAILGGALAQVRKGGDR
jgi:hypothetical protein